jgi:predicted nucleotidyltransferase
MVKKKVSKKEGVKKERKSTPHTLNIATDREVALDFATKVYQEFDRMIKSVILFGSSAKKLAITSSDIDIIILLDDVSIRWDQELIAHYRERLAELIKANPYKKSLHINTVKLSTWWDDLNRGDPVVLNVIRYGDPILDHGGFFTPLKILLEQGKIHSTPEAIYTLLQRAPNQLIRAKNSLFVAIDGLYWCVVDSAHAALIAAGERPASPEHIADKLEEIFVSKKMLKSKYIDTYSELHSLNKGIIHSQINEIKGSKIDELFIQADKFLNEMARIVNELVDKK